MATKGKGRKVSMSAEEQAAQKALDAFIKTHEGKKLTDKQADEKKALTESLGKLKFVRLANGRVPRAMKSLDSIGQLAGKAYVKSEAQIKAICDALDAKIKRVRADLEGKKETKSGFQLPGFDEAK